MRGVGRCPQLVWFWESTGGQVYMCVCVLMWSCLHLSWRYCWVVSCLFIDVMAYHNKSHPLLTTTTLPYHLSTYFDNVYTSVLSFPEIAKPYWVWWTLITVMWILIISIKIQTEKIWQGFEATVTCNKKLFPGSPTCIVGDKLVPVYTTCFPSGSITLDTLTNSLKHVLYHLDLDWLVDTPSLQIDDCGSSNYNANTCLYWDQTTFLKTTGWVKCYLNTIGLDLQQKKSVNGGELVSSTFWL